VCALFIRLFCTAYTALSAAGAAPTQPAGRFTDGTRHTIGPLMATLVSGDQLERPSRRLPIKIVLEKKTSASVTGKTPVHSSANHLSFPVALA